MKRIALLSAAALFAFAACKKNDNNGGPSTGPTAKALFINATLHESSLSVKVNDTLQQNATNLTFLTNKGYMNVRSGNVKLGFIRTTDQGEIANITSALATGSSYSVFAVGNGTTGSPSAILVVSDDLTAPASGTAKIRFANLSAEPTFSLSAVVTNTNGTQKLDSNIATNVVTSFKTVTAGTYSITMGDNSTLQSQTLTGQNLTSGKIYTYVFTGKDGATGTSAFKLSSIGNN